MSKENGTTKDFFEGREFEDLVVNNSTMDRLFRTTGRRLDYLRGRHPEFTQVYDLFSGDPDQEDSK